MKEKLREKDYGLLIRNQLDKFSKAIHPYAKIFFPHFKSVHYFYIISMTILGSILVYPVKNMKYIDVLFLTAGACTQAGLNTVNLNDITLYQQIVVYVLATLTTPILIHGSLLLVRLYWFERYFDDIKAKSKLDYKMRRSATLAAREHSLNATQLNTYANQLIGLSANYAKAFSPNEIFQLSSQSSIPSVETTNIRSNSVSAADLNTSNSSAELVSESPRIPNDESQHDSHEDTGDMAEHSKSTEGIRFGNLPHPQKMRQKEVDPSDMYRSIRMLQRNQDRTQRPQSEDDDVLVIKSPKEIEKGLNDPIYTKKSQIHFDTTGPRRPRQKRRRFSRNAQRWSKLRHSLMSSNVHPHSRGLSAGSLHDDETADDASIDSEGQSDRGLKFFDRYDSDLSSRDSRSDDDAKSDNIQKKSDLSYGDNNLDHKNVRDSLEESISRGTLSGIRSRVAKHRPRRTETSNLHSSTDDLSSQNRRNNSSFSRLRSFASTGSSSHFRPDDEEGHPLRKAMSTNYLSWIPQIGRNSTFVHLTEEQKEELGGVEYRAIKLLIRIIVVYYVGFHILAVVFILPYVELRHYYKQEIREQGVSPTWWSFFAAQSSFNDLGLTLTMNSFQLFNRSIFVMIVVPFFIVIGNTGFPVMLRLIIWILFKISRPLSLFRESLGFLLDHPRRCFTLLFPSIPTWWLFFILVVLNGIDLVLFVILDLHNSTLTELPVGIRVLNGLFQAFSTRTAGFTVLDLGALHPAMHVSYMIMMYISVLPLAISIRRTNVYEEQSLGVYLKDENELNEKNPKSFIGAHLRNQLSFDLWFIVLGLFIICLAEGGKLSDNDVNFSVFSVLFEIISAYGTVGLSLGYPHINESFSYEFNTISKLVIIAMMIRGRHRGLPYSLDRAIMFPSAKMERRDDLQAKNALKRSKTSDPDAHNHNLLRKITRSLTHNQSGFSRRPSTGNTAFPRSSSRLLESNSSHHVDSMTSNEI